MRVALAEDSARTGDTNRSRLWAAAAAGVVVIGSIASMMPQNGLSLGGMLERASLAMRKPDAILAFNSPHSLTRHFQTIGYDLEAVRNGGAAVPRIFLARVPNGLADVKQSTQRKQVFLSVMLPLVLEANEQVQRKRAQLLVIDAKLAAGKPLTADQQKRLEAIAAEYGVDADRTDILLRRVDAVPPSLALAQAAIESGWGTSRFIREGNAVFGEWTWGSEGLVPNGREEGKSHKIRTFGQLLDSVRSYVHNLNTHAAYRDFRQTRHTLRAEGQPLAGLALVPTLISYSELKGKYLSLLRSIITSNELQSLDGARLRDKPAPRATDA
ncbi:MAG: glucosaminidase domain-containing protein [Gammaproteobacteria bacterium]|jgi:Bax protein